MLASSSPPPQSSGAISTENTSGPASGDPGSRRLAYTLDHTEYYLDVSDITCADAGQLWLSLFIVTGIALPCLFELLILHAGPAEGASQMVPFLGYVGQLLTGGLVILANRSWNAGRWHQSQVAYLLLSSMGNGAAQALDYIALKEAGVVLYTIFHSSVTLFACMIAVFALRRRITSMQWAGVAMVVIGLILTAVPDPVDAQHSFVVGLVCAVSGSFCLAASYPLAELVFKSSAAAGSKDQSEEEEAASVQQPTPPPAELCSFLGALANVLAFSLWIGAYTVPRWQQAVLDPIARSQAPAAGVVVSGLYVSYAMMIGLHSLSFWKTMGSLGTVPAAVSKGVQQAGAIALAHLLFCDEDPHECLTHNRGSHTMWSQLQKPASFILCCLGCVVYAVLKKRTHGVKPSFSVQAAGGQEPLLRSVQDEDEEMLQGTVTRPPAPLRQYR